MRDDMDMVVIGSGPGGYKAAVQAARLGARVALVERGAAGGNCLNHGCVPKKTLLHLATLIEDVANLNGRGLSGTVRGDFIAALAHKDTVIQSMRQNLPAWLRHLGIDLVTGEARLLDARRVEVRPTAGEPPRILTAEHIVIATGSVPRAHPQCGFDGRRIISSRELLAGLDPMPRSLLCVGGGAIGAEFGFLLHQFGVRVTVIDSAERLLDKPGIPWRASDTLARKFGRLGVEVHTGISVAGHRLTQDGISVDFTDGRQGEYDRVLVAIGRKPITDGLGLEQAGVDLDPLGYIRTDGYLETTAAGVYAVGDVKPGPMTANAALYDAKVAVANALNGKRVLANYNRVPMVIDSALEIAAVGLSEEQADRAGFEPDVARISLNASAKARARHDCEGFIEVVHDEETGQMLGGCIVGPEAGEQIHLLAAACQSSHGMWFFTDLCYTHPSWCEEMENAIDPYTTAFARSGKLVFAQGIYATPD